ncbi:RidA family protein [Metapseudomonas resinovorans]|uniref:Uncharacterized protein n=1 Tax=Metapseudomonas resinovorans NBRC 106553 TaxID=1245471 RepID=S6ANX1_METRE|nr:Rid family hydrolase [Pseudomonas resinovorans]BAN50755.1 hypothetical protein PCA10_50230 [Pseudomonas resinovorans NBRC 106553]
MERQSINPPSVFNTLQYGFSQAVVCEGGRLVHLSGQVGVDAQERLAGPDLASQTRAALENIGLLLAEVGGNLSDVIMLRIYLVDTAKHDQMPIVEALKTFFPHSPPASSWVVVSALSEPEWLIEIEAQAVIQRT